MTINVLRWPFSRVESPAFVQKASERGLLVEFLRRGKMRQIEEKASERGASVRVSRLERGLFGCFLSHFEAGNPESSSLTDVVSHCKSAF